MTDQPHIPAWGPRRIPVTLLGVTMALITLMLRPGDVVQALALSSAAALALTLLLAGRFRQVVGGIVTLLGVGMIGAGWGTIPVIIAALGVAFIGVVIVLVSPHWPKGRNFGRSPAATTGPWRSMDDGVDPTEEPRPVI